MRAPTRIVAGCLAAAAFFLFWGCAGTGSAQAPKVDSSGRHPADWLTTHWSDYAKNPDQCIACHGSTTDPNSSGGTSGVSCFSCHAGGAAHPEGWSAGLQHGRLGAQAAPGSTTGLATCARCHGADYGGGIAASSCRSCHTAAPHPDAPWTSGTPETRASHTATNVGNAPECFKCHAATVQPDPPLSPGCYNTTMCHGTP